MSSPSEPAKPTFQCPTCGSWFASVSTFSRHKDVHSTTRRFVCALCGKSYKQLAGLRAHQALHTGNGYKCEICNKDFFQKTNLRIHMNAHRNIRPHKCLKCPKRFTQSSNLNSHIFSVHHSCYRCWTETSSKDDLKTHLKECAISHYEQKLPNTEPVETQLGPRLPSRLSRSVRNKVDGLKSVLLLAQTGTRVSKPGTPKCRAPYERKIRTYPLADAKEATSWQ